MNAAAIDITTPGRPPFDEPGRSRRPSPALAGALMVAGVVHLGLGAYLWQARFEPAYRTFAEEVTEVRLVRPLTPPPPPPAKVEPPPRKLRTPAPVQPRPPEPAAATPVAPLPVPPIPQRIEIAKPPVLALEPPPQAAPAPPPSAPPVITNPDWLRRPSGAEIARYYPDRAARRGIEGRAVIGCQVTDAGRLERCRVATETPASEGFGEAALKMSRHFKMRPMTRDGDPVSGGTIRIPIRFALEA